MALAVVKIDHGKDCASVPRRAAAMAPVSGFMYNSYAIAREPRTQLHCRLEMARERCYACNPNVKIASAHAPAARRVRLFCVAFVIFMFFFIFFYRNIDFREKNGDPPKLAKVPILR